MSATRRPRFDSNTLRMLAGNTVFARGEAYFRDGLVDILAIEPGRIIARVVGTEDYRTVVTGQGKEIDGECSCPAFERDGFCKHMVAVALATTAAVARGEGDSGSALARVRGYLKSKSLDALVEMIMDIAERDRALLRKLEIAAAAHGTDGKAFEAQMRRAIREATRTRGFVDYRRAAGWAADVDAALDMLAEATSGPRAALAVELAEDAVAAIERAIEHIDDSDGHCGALLERVQGIHLDACRAARPDPVALARYLFRCETTGDCGTFHGAVSRYKDVLGETGLAEYRRLAQDAWDKLPARSSAGHRAAGDGFDDFRLASILDFFAERDGDVETRIALRARDLSSPWAHLQLAEFCLAQGRDEDALRRAEEGLWLFEDKRPDERLVFFTVDLLLNAKRKPDAEAHLWRAFEKEPSMSLHDRLRSLAGKPATQRVMNLLQERLAGKPRSPWHSPADLLVSLMTKEEMFDAAWTVLRAHPASRGVKEALARASEELHAPEALAVYAERVEELANMGGNPAYTEAAALIVRMAALRSAAEQTAYLATIKERHGRKRNFMKLLS